MSYSKFDAVQALKASLLSLALVSSSAIAGPIVGTLEMTGGFSITGATPVSPTHINFWSLAGDDKFTVTGATDDFLPALNQIGTITDLDLDLNASNVCIDCTITDFYTVDVFSFDLLSLEVTLNDPNNLNLAGIGTIRAAGFDNTEGTWAFTSDHTGGGVFTWSSTTVAASVPEPGTVALLLAGLVGLFAARRQQAITEDSA